MRSGAEARRLKRPHPGAARWHHLPQEKDRLAERQMEEGVLPDGGPPQERGRRGPPATALAPMPESSLPRSSSGQIVVYFSTGLGESWVDERD